MRLFCMIFRYVTGNLHVFAKVELVLVYNTFFGLLVLALVFHVEILTVRIGITFVVLFLDRVADFS
jgi:hypothetical protein